MDVGKSKVKILNLSTFDYGGAGAASVTFNGFLRKNGWFSVLMVRESNGVSSDVLIYRKKTFSRYMSYKIQKRRFRRKAYEWDRLQQDRKFKGTVVFDDCKSMASAKSILQQINFVPDIIFIHWVYNFITPEILWELKSLTGAKIISVLMDNAAITGGCHYPFACKGYTGNCLPCPLFGRPTDFASRILARKEKFYPSDMEFWATTADCERVAVSSLGKTRRAVPILFPIDSSIVPSETKEELRKRFDIGTNQKVLVVGCSSFSAVDNRKGFEYIMLSLESIKIRFPELKDKIILLVVGADEPGILDRIGFKTRDLGFLPMRELMKVYKAADLFFSASTEDSGPLMVNQSIATGTPVAAFNIGVAKDLVVDGETGVLAPLFDYESLADKIGRFLSNADYARISSNCILWYKKKEEELSLLKQVERIIKE